MKISNKMSSTSVSILDRKLSSVFKALHKRQPDGSKGDTTHKEFSVVRERMVDDGFRRTLDHLFADFVCTSEQRPKHSTEAALGYVREFRNQGFMETAALLFVAWREVLSGVSLEVMLPTAPDAASVEIWIKAVNAPVPEIEKQLLADPCATYATAGADWLMEHAKPDHLIPLLELFLSRRARPTFLRPWCETLVATLSKDKRGALLGAALRHPWPTEGCIATLADAVRSDRTLLRMMVDLLPAMLAQKTATPAVTAFVNDVFRVIVSTEDAEREFMTGALSRLGTGILLADQRGPQSEAALAVIENSARQLRNLTRDETLQARTWLLENLSRKTEPTDGKLQVTLEGARHLALAFGKAAQGFAAKDILTVTARNLGLSPIGKKGDAVLFNPLQHEDVEGGLVPGNPVVIDEEGWAVRQEALIRAKVKRAQEGSRV